MRSRLSVPPHILKQGKLGVIFKSSVLGKLLINIPVCYEFETNSVCMFSWLNRLFEERQRLLFAIITRIHVGGAVGDLVMDKLYAHSE